MESIGFQIAYWIVSVLILGVSVFFSVRATIQAVKIGRRLNSEKEKDTEKRELFLTLFAYRGKPVHPSFVEALNKIDVVFDDTPKVLEYWHKHFRSLEVKREEADDAWRLERADLLSEMAQTLGYKQIKQTDMMKHYYPEYHNKQVEEDALFRQTLLQFLQTGIELQQTLIEIYQSQHPVDEQPEQPKTLNL